MPLPRLKSTPQDSPSASPSASRWNRYRASREWRDFWQEDPIVAKRDKLSRQLRKADGLPKDTVIVQLDLLDWLESLPDRELARSTSTPPAQPERSTTFIQDRVAALRGLRRV